MEYTLLYSSFFLLIALIVFKFLLRTKISKNLPPSPRALPILGHLHLLKHPLHRTLLTLSEKYGPVFSLKFGCRNVIVVSSPSAVEECFNKNDIVFANHAHFILGKYVDYNNSTLSMAPYGEHWRNLRRLCSLEILSTNRLNMLLGIRREEIKSVLRKLYAVSRNGFAKVELGPLFSELSFNIIITMMAGKRDYGEDKSKVEQAREFRELIKEIFEYAGASNPADFFPFLQWVDFQGYVKKCKGLGKRSDSFLQALVDEQRSIDAGSDRRNTMLSHLLALQESQPEYYTDEIIKGLIVTLLLAGTDTTTGTSEWAMSNLLNHPEVLNKARADIENLLGPDQLMDESDISKLPCLQNIISETLRLYPATPLLVPRVSSDDCTIEGYHIPRGTMLFVNSWALQRDPKYWNDSTSFKPGRFESGELTANTFMPFGLGRRACPGTGLAQRVMKLTLGLLIQCFDWERVDGKEVDMNEGRGLTLPRAVPLEAMCKPRSILMKALAA